MNRNTRGTGSAPSGTMRARLTKFGSLGKPLPQTAGNRTLHGGLALALSLFVFAALAGPALSQPAGEAENGEALARKLCVNCHKVSADQSGPINPDVPTFFEIADLPDQSAERIAGAIVVPHPPMPQMALPRNDIADLAAYILSLRE